MSDSPSDMDKWLALVVGNLLHDDKPEDRDFFNGRLENPENLFEMIKGWNYYRGMACPLWAWEYFIGIRMKKNYISLEHINLYRINFSYSIFKHISMKFSNLVNVMFYKCIFEGKVNFRGCDLTSSLFSEIELNNIEIIFENVSCAKNLFFPLPLIKKYAPSSEISEFLTKTTYIPAQNTKFNIGIAFFYPLKGLLIYGLKNNLFDIPEIKSWFDYESEEDREVFEGLIDGLEEFDGK